MPDIDEDTPHTPHASHVWVFVTKWTCKNCATEKGSYGGSQPCTNQDGKQWNPEDTIGGA